MCKYISGWQALNLSHDGGACDWHSALYFENNKPKKYYDSNESKLGLQSIAEHEFNHAFFHGKALVASHARAIADLILSGQWQDLKGFAAEYLNERQKHELYTLLTPFLSANKIDKYLKFEMPKIYYEAQHA